MSLDEALNMGYFTAYRLWNTLDELRARDLSELCLALDNAQGNEEYRSNIRSWLEERQPRRYSRNKIPKEVLERFEESWKKNGGRVQRE